MKASTKNEWRNVSRLVRFLFWYATAVAVLFVVMPAAASFLEAQYESLSGTLRIAMVSGFFAVIAVWQVLRQRDRMRAELEHYARAQPPHGAAPSAFRDIGSSRAPRIPRKAA